MCGINGIIDIKRKFSSDAYYSMVQEMNKTLKHRGPDDSGIWINKAIGVGLGHARLSIIDLSPEGHQPMISTCERYVVVFNGEIYNYKDVRNELENKENFNKWRGYSDTEVLLAAISFWGLDKAIKRFNGMFAFALWDRKEKILFLTRDRLGKKPLYYGLLDDVFIFGSELKALRSCPNWKGEIDRDALTLFLRYNCIPSPYSIYKDIKKLTPGSVLKISFKDPNNLNLDDIYQYWSAEEVIKKSLNNQFEGNELEAINGLGKLLSDAIKIRMESDVPLGVLLSGGIDSSIVAALMQKQSSRAIKTFTIGFNEKAYNEANHAKLIAKYLGTKHYELYATPEKAMQVIQSLPALYDEPFSDSSQIPTYLVSELTRQYVTVAVSGDGGDELFAGYNRHFWVQDIWEKIGRLPFTIRKSLSHIITGISPDTWDSLFNVSKMVLPKIAQQRNPGYKIHKIAEVLKAKSLHDMYKILVSHWKDPEQIVLNSKEPSVKLIKDKKWLDQIDFSNQMMYFDLVRYLPDDILVKVDRASMGVSLEVRSPFLDHRVVEFAWSLPKSMKIRKKQGKWLPKQLLYKYVPSEIVDRPKMGFAIPLDKWLCGPLRDWSESLLNQERLKREGFFNVDPIRCKWKEHVSGKRNWQYHLWTILMFQAWLDTQ